MLTTEGAHDCASGLCRKHRSSVLMTCQCFDIFEQLLDSLDPCPLATRMGALSPCVKQGASQLRAKKVLPRSVCCSQGMHIVLQSHLQRSLAAFDLCKASLPGSLLLQGLEGSCLLLFLLLELKV